MNNSKQSNDSTATSSFQNQDQFPDVAHNDKPAFEGELSRVGMSKIELPVIIKSGEDSIGFRQQANCDAYVSLDDPKAKGIHMSRLYLLTQEFLTHQELSAANIEKLLHSFVQSHKAISKRAFFNARLNWPVLKKALKSQYKSWHFYPVQLQAQMNNGVYSLQCKLEITYSSTCPCSAALARQLIQEKFRNDFSDNDSHVTKESVEEWLGQETSILATPHGQRSKAFVEVQISNENLQIDSLISKLETALATPVQGIVKREDEQEFARLNGANLMFSEDAARRLSTCLESLNSVRAYKLRVEHYESLHAHDATAEAQSHNWPI